MIIASVPHSGSRFLHGLLGWEFVHVYEGESLSRIRSHYLIAVPLRHPMRVAESWKRRGKPIVEHPKHEAMCVMFRTLIDQIDPLRPIYLPLDNAKRDESLAQLAKATRRHLTTDWTPVTDDLIYPAVTLSQEEVAAVESLMTDPFFERVGYTAPIRF